MNNKSTTILDCKIKIMKMEKKENLWNCYFV